MSAAVPGSGIPAQPALLGIPAGLLPAAALAVGLLRLVARRAGPRPPPRGRRRGWPAPTCPPAATSVTLPVTRAREGGRDPAGRRAAATARSGRSSSARPSQPRAPRAGAGGGPRRPRRRAPDRAAPGRRPGPRARGYRRAGSRSSRGEPCGSASSAPDGTPVTGFSDWIARGTATRAGERPGRPLRARRPHRRPRPPRPAVRPRAAPGAREPRRRRRPPDPAGACTSRFPGGEADHRSGRRRRRSVPHGPGELRRRRRGRALGRRQRRRPRDGRAARGLGRDAPVRRAARPQARFGGRPSPIWRSSRGPRSTPTPPPARSPAGSSWCSRAAAILSVVLAAAGLVLIAAADLADERPHLDDLEAMGVAPRTLRAHLVVRAVVLARRWARSAGSCSARCSRRRWSTSCQLGAGTSAAVPPLRTAVPAGAVAAALAVFAVAALAPVAVLAGRRAR